MKIKSFYLIVLVSIFAVLSLNSCSKKLQEVTVKPVSTNIKGEIGKYLQIVDNTYKISKSSGKTMGGGYNYSITVNIKNVSVTKSDFDNVDKITLTVLDSQGLPLTGIREFELDYSSNGKVEQLLKTEGASDFLTFKGYADKGQAIQKKGLPKPDQIGGFVITSYAEVSVVSESSGNSTTSGVSETVSASEQSTGGNENWNSILDSYEKYINQYISLLKKANAGDVSAMSEYASMMEKATDFADKLENASDDLSTAQMERFTKLQLKLANAAAGL
jgi:hypothetical protein